MIKGTQMTLVVAAACLALTMSGTQAMDSAIGKSSGQETHESELSPEQESAAEKAVAEFFEAQNDFWTADYDLPKTRARSTSVSPAPAPPGTEGLDDIKNSFAEEGLQILSAATTTKSNFFTNRSGQCVVVSDVTTTWQTKDESSGLLEESSATETHESAISLTGGSAESPKATVISDEVIDPVGGLEDPAEQEELPADEAPSDDDRRGN
ncbi:hypothetical protein LWF01_18365 [Saxibacter everestensis]|uniref:Secreted protein n=1 Tax=Saxibacter everestensis TaxID=2909229 RepID=A0ABY8QT57_9MICO|nr:hypothetical protein LWF01_18365 [Brevibacteriaceae bacterium ZFBP1038]